MSGDRQTTSYMPSFDDVMHEHEQLQRWGKPGQPRQPVDYETHIANNRLFGRTRGKGVVGGEHTPDPLF